MNQIAENFFCSKRELNCVARQSMEYIEIYKSDCNLSTNINSVQSKNYFHKAIYYMQKLYQYLNKGAYSSWDFAWFSHSNGIPIYRTTMAKNNFHLK